MHIERYSQLVGSIYDCAVEPERWPATLQLIGEELGFVSSVMLVVDFRTNEQWFLAEWNTTPRYQQLLLDKFAATSAAMFRAGLAHLGPDEPLTVSRGPFNLEEFRRSPMYLEWAKPQGYSDAANCIVLADKDRLGSVALVQHERNGMVSDGQLASTKLLIPHLRRSVTIGDFIELRLRQAQSLAACLDHLAAGIVLVDQAARIVHANAAAEDIFRDGSVARAVNGRLIGSSAISTQRLKEAIATAASDETAVGAGIGGIALGAPGEPPAIAHVLPLSSGMVRPRLLPGASAAVFICTDRDGRQLDVAALAQPFGLTRAELRLLDRLVAGDTLHAAGATLSIAEATAKTHLARIFAKMGVNRQSDLVRLVMTMLPPIRRGAASD